MVKRNRIFTTKGKKLYKYFAGSPYWDWLFNRGMNEKGSGNVDHREPSIANPDVSEEGSLNNLHKDQQEIEQRKETLKYILRTAIENCGLAEQERIVVQRVIYDAMPTTEVAKELNIDHSAVSHAMKRAVKKIKRKVKTLAHTFEI